jgi:hypothetical protein
MKEEFALFAVLLLELGRLVLCSLLSDWYFYHVLLRFSDLQTCIKLDH